MISCRGLWPTCRTKPTDAAPTSTCATTGARCLAHSGATSPTPTTASRGSVSCWQRRNRDGREGLLAHLEEFRPDEKLNDRIEALIEKLAADDFDAREAASRELRRIGPAAEARLRGGGPQQRPGGGRAGAGPVAATARPAATQRSETILLAVLQLLKSLRDPRGRRTVLAVIPQAESRQLYDAACEALCPPHALSTSNCSVEE